MMEPVAIASAQRTPIGGGSGGFQRAFGAGTGGGGSKGRCRPVGTFTRRDRRGPDRAGSGSRYRAGTGAAGGSGRRVATLHNLHHGQQGLRIGRHLARKGHCGARLDKGFGRARAGTWQLHPAVLLAGVVRPRTRRNLPCLRPPRRWRRASCRTVWAGRPGMWTFGKSTRPSLWLPWPSCRIWRCRRIGST